MPTPRNFIDKRVTKFAATHKARLGNYFLFEQFQIQLPPDWNAIILPAKVGIGPVGARP
jgi:hypothetical protein